MDYLGLATDLSRTQAAGLIGYRCRDGMCGADDCKACRPNAMAPSELAEQRAERFNARLESEELATEIVSDVWSGESGYERNHYTRMVLELARAYANGRPINDLARNLATKVIKDIYADVERQS